MVNPNPGTEAGVEKGTIKIRTSFLFLQFLLFFFKPVISIDGGEPEKHPWGESDHEVDPGQHTVNVHISYFFGWQVSKAAATVSVGANETVSLAYRPPLFVTQAGSLKVVPA